MANENATTAKDMAKVIAIDYVSQFAEGIEPLLEVLGISEPELIPAGSKIDLYRVSGTLENTTVGELEDVPLSKYKEEIVKSIEAKLKKARRLTSEEAILKSGLDRAVSKTDAKLLKDMQLGIRDDFYTFIATGTGTATDGATIQAAMANVAGKLASVADERGYVDPTPVFFVNPEDVYEYLGDHATYNVESAFGFNYVKNFLGIGTAILSSRVEKGDVLGTHSENIRCFCVDLGALNDAGFDYVTDETGLIGIGHDVTYTNGSVESNFRTGVQFVPEYVDAIYKAEITPTV